MKTLRFLFVLMLVVAAFIPTSTARADGCYPEGGCIFCWQSPWPPYQSTCLCGAISGWTQCTSFGSWCQNGGDPCQASLIVLPQGQVVASASFGSEMARSFSEGKPSILASWSTERNLSFEILPNVVWAGGIQYSVVRACSGIIAERHLDPASAQVLRQGSSIVAI